MARRIVAAVRVVFRQKSSVQVVERQPRALGQKILEGEQHAAHGLRVQHGVTEHQGEFHID